MANVEPVCRCGTDRVVDGTVIVCPHCDTPCKMTGCSPCALLGRTCTDCRKVHVNRRGAAACERDHPYVG